MTASAERAVREEEVPAAPETSPEAQAHAQRAKSVPSGLPSALPLPLAPGADGDSPWSPEAVRAWVLARAKAIGERPIDLIHGPPASIGAMHARHQQAAAHWKSPIPHGLRVGWGWLHTAVYAPVLILADSTVSPAGAVLVVLFLLACIHWL